MDGETLGNNIREYRTAHHWTQEELAIAAGLDVRTVQRAESGRSIALETLRAIASAFQITVDALSVSTEACETALAEFYEKYSVIEMKGVKHGRLLCECLCNADAMLLHRGDTLEDDQADGIAGLEQIVKDCMDIWRVLEPLQKREAEKDVQGFIDRLGYLGVAISVGSQTIRLKDSEGGSPFHVTVLYIAAVSGSTPLRVMVREKNIPFQFI